MIKHIAVSQWDSRVALDLAPEAWRILDEYASRHAQTRAYAVTIALKLGLADLCEQMRKEQKRR